MNIDLKEISIREVVEGFVDNAEEGVVGYGGKLNIRPPYQREFIYNTKQRDEVINTVKKNFPLNVMYWVKSNDGYELMDGQQRTLSICQYVNGDYSFENRFFHNLREEEKNQILDYKLMIYICEGTDTEKLDWFQIINIAGEELTNQELRNAVYAGPWTMAAKKYFSKTGCPAYQIGEKYMKGTPIRQEYLETVLKWISSADGRKIEEFMGVHQHDVNAQPLIDYYNNVLKWVKKVFPHYRREMKGLDWGLFYNQYKDNEYNADEIEARIVKLMADDDITKKAGVYEYILDSDERHLSIRAFDNRTKRTVYERQGGICPFCHNHFDINEMEADHITPWHAGGQTILDNCQMLCKDCNRRKSGR